MRLSLPFGLASCYGGRSQTAGGLMPRIDSLAISTTIQRGGSLIHQGGADGGNSVGHTVTRTIRGATSEKSARHAFVVSGAICGYRSQPILRDRLP